MGSNAAQGEKNDRFNVKAEQKKGDGEALVAIESIQMGLRGEDDIIREERNIIRVKVQQKKGTKKVTIIENIPADLREHVLSSLKKEMGCGGIILDDGSSIQLQGDKTNLGIVGSLKRYIKGCKVELSGRVS